MAMLPRLSFKQVNNVLFGLIVVINLYVIAAPLWPQVDYWWQSHHTDRQAQLAQLIHHPKPTAQPTTTQPNGLIIPAMLLQQPTL